jgi:hypothetical protein
MHVAVRNGRAARLHLKFASTPEVRDQFTFLQQSWIRLAAEIESAQSVLEIIDQIELLPPVERPSKKALRPGSFSGATVVGT